MRSGELYAAQAERVGDGRVDATRPRSPEGAFMRLAQLALEDLSAWVLRQSVGEDDALGDLERGQDLMSVVQNSCLVQRRARLRNHDGYDRLDPVRMRHADHRDFRHAGEPVNRLLDLAARDIFAAGLDHVLLAVDDADKALFVDGREVARMEPAAAEGFRRLLLIVVIAGHQMRRAMDDLADLAGRDIAH